MSIAIAPTILLKALGASEAAPAFRVLVTAINPPCERVIDAQFNQTWHTSLGAGISFLFERDALQAIHLYSQMNTSRGSWAAYSSPLPLDLQWGMSQEQVLERFGTPHKGTGVHWAIYKLPQFGFRVGFHKGALVTFDALWLGHQLLREIP